MLNLLTDLYLMILTAGEDDSADAEDDADGTDDSADDDSNDDGTDGDANSDDDSDDDGEERVSLKDMRKLRSETAKYRK